MPKVKLNGVEIYYEDHGPRTAPAIVFSTLLYMDTSIFDPMVEAFSDEFRVITYDHRGQGKSGKGGKRSDLTASTQDAIALIEYLKLEHVHFVGNCLGAYVGLHIAVKRSDLLKSCTLMGAMAEAENPQFIKEMDLYLDSMKKHGARSGMMSFANTGFGPSFRASVDPMNVARREKVMEHLMSIQPDELENMRQKFHHPHISKEELQKISVPVLIIAGDEDQPNNVAAYKRLALEIPHVTYKTVPHAGYAIVVEQPYEVIHLVHDHVEIAERIFLAQFAQSKLSKGATRARK
jgi:3-oxoadipate enol-lactonase